MMHNKSLPKSHWRFAVPGVLLLMVVAFKRVGKTWRERASTEWCSSASLQLRAGCAQCGPSQGLHLSLCIKQPFVASCSMDLSNRFLTHTFGIPNILWEWVLPFECTASQLHFCLFENSYLIISFDGPSSFVWEIVNNHAHLPFSIFFMILCSSNIPHLYKAKEFLFV